jgi:hypothetical protein
MSLADCILKIPALDGLMAIVLKVSETFCGAEHVAQSFVNILFPSVVAHLIFNDQFNEKLLESWRDQYLLKFDDVRFFTLANIRCDFVVFFVHSILYRTSDCCLPIADC